MGAQDADPDAPAAHAAGPRAPSPGGQRDFNAFYTAHFRVLTLQLHAYVGDLTEAQDLVQEAFCRAYTRWDQVAGYDEPVAWIRRVAWNLATTRWRRQRRAAAYLLRQREQHEPGPNPDRVAVVQALRALPERQRRAVVLHHVADLSVAEIAAQEGVAEGTVKSWLHRGRTALAAGLSDVYKESRDG
ncbi:MAG: SigE family RNA polymerase sigma factor [Micromonosporaceae bacterium]|nr:SigE family RNA polymerase sigma factor [Micromonosporaceae bacterium]